MAFANCQTKTKKLELTKGLVINSSVTFDSTKIGGTVLLTSKDNYEKMITIEGENLTVDFGGITLLGTDYLTRPNEFGGVAIHIKNSKNLTIQNLNVSGYFIALEADSVQNLMIRNCNFSYNYRADSSANFDINKVEIGAITLNNCSDVKILECKINHNQNGIIANQTYLSNISLSEISFNSKVGLYFNQSNVEDILMNQINWNLEAGNWYQNAPISGRYTSNLMTHNGKVSTLERWFNSNDFSFSNIDLATNLNLEAYEFEKGSMTTLAAHFPKGEAYKLRTKYGVYNFEYPAIFLRTVHENEYVFAMFGPQIGNWKFVNAENVRSTNLKTGAFPATFRIQKEDVTKSFSIEFEFIGTGFYDEFGVWNKKGKVYKFGAKI